MAIHSSVFAWKIPWTEEPAVHRVAKSQTPLSNFTFFHFHAGISGCGSDVVSLNSVVLVSGEGNGPEPLSITIFFFSKTTAILPVTPCHVFARIEITQLAAIE